MVLPEELRVAGMTALGPLQPALPPLHERSQHRVGAPTAPFHVGSEEAEGLLAALVGVEVPAGADHAQKRVRLQDQQTNRQRDKQTDRQTDRQTDKQTDKQTNREELLVSVEWRL